ncbi:trans-aconitate 2-methyltransferase [Comamonas composti]|uniref:trans-aconitate 2-methyltransferase n=1 Tax=Comamonas composti TaxID=408558 RepID=UPI0003F6E0DE|nr:trans-aconitate 2-methyltransferase [Comamonas composti]
MLDWNPALYLHYANERTRPAAELLARVPQLEARHVVDLGCGPGNSTELLVQRFAAARVTGLDNSPSMLEQARQQLPTASFALADIVSWASDLQTAGPAPDLIYANASLQWVGGHEALIPRLFARLAAGGVLAIQMPDNRQEPTHALMREVAALPQFAAHIGDAASVRTGILPIRAYYDLLAAPDACAQSIDVWHTVYQHPMESAEAIVQWVRGTGLKPFVEALPESLQQEFLNQYLSRVEQAYEQRADGRRLLAFPRLFIVAQRKA